MVASLRDWARRPRFRKWRAHHWDALLVLVVVGAWAALMVGPYHAFRGGNWDFNRAGTAAEWTGGLFTGAAVAVALRTLIYDRREREGEEARRHVRGVTAYPRSNDDGSVDLHIVNGSSAPIWDVQLRVSTSSIGPDNRVEVLLTGGAPLYSAKQLLPEDRVPLPYISAPDDGPWPDRRRSISTVLEYTDSARNRWMDDNGKVARTATEVEIHPGLTM